MRHYSIEQAASACVKAQVLYLRDVAESGRVAVSWNALDFKTRNAYVDRAVTEIESAKVVTFPSVVRVQPSELIPHAVRNIESAIDDLVNAANGVESECAAVDLQMVIRDLTVKLNAASEVAWHREQQFYPKGA